MTLKEKFLKNKMLTNGEIKIADDYAIEFFLWVKDNEKIIKKGKRITDKQLLEIFKKEKGL